MLSICQHSKALIVDVDHDVVTAWEGITLTYFCPTCQKVWLVHFAYAANSCVTINSYQVGRE